jgi:hypothetical protein
MNDKVRVAHPRLRCFWDISGWALKSEEEEEEEEEQCHKLEITT